MGYLYWILFVILSPALLMFTIWLWLHFIPLAISKLLPEKHEPACCDIDPRCHPAFVWDSEGRGIIGNTDTGERVGHA